MTDDLPKLFDRCTPRPAPPELRARTLSAVERGLSRRPVPRWERAVELAVAASLLLGIGMNVWLWRSGETGQMGGPEPGPSVAGRRIQHQSLRAEPRKRDKDTAGSHVVGSHVGRSDVGGGDRYQRLLHELSQGRIPESL